MVEGLKNNTQNELPQSRSLIEVYKSDRFHRDSELNVKPGLNMKLVGCYANDTHNQTKSGIIQFESGLNIENLNDELKSLQKRMNEINSKLEENLAVLKEKKLKNENIRKLLQTRELVSTKPTEISYDESACSCKNKCVLF